MKCRTLCAKYENFFKEVEMRKFVILFVVFFLAGCGPTLTQLESNEDPIIMSVKEDYRIVYRRIYEEAREKYAPSYLTGIHVDGQLYKNEGHIVTYLETFGRYYISCYIQPNGSDRSVVTIYHDAFVGAADFARWAEGKP